MDRFISLVKQNDTEHFMQEASNIVFDEGILEILLFHVGKNGNLTLLPFLMDHGAENIDNALASAIFYHQNELVMQHLGGKIFDISLLLQAAIDGDNLEMLKEVVARSDDHPVKRLRTNRTSAWYAYFEGLPADAKEFWAMGFGPSTKINLSVVNGHINYSNLQEALKSELIEPLPYTYDKLEEFNPNYLTLAQYQTDALVSGESRNYARLEWIIDAAIRSGDDVRPTNVKYWIQTLLPMIGNPNATGIVSKARQFLGREWEWLVGPIQSDEQIEFILQFVKPSPKKVKGFFPVQHQAIDRWIDRCSEGLNSDGSGQPTILSDLIGLKWITSNYPSRERGIGEMGRSRFDPSYDFHGALLKMFDARPDKTLQYALGYQLLDVWNELSPRHKFEKGRKHAILSAVYGAADGGINSLCEELLSMLDQPPLYMENYDKYPRINRLFRGGETNKVRSISQASVAAISRADEQFSKNQAFIEERLRFLWK